MSTRLRRPGSRLPPDTRPPVVRVWDQLMRRRADRRSVAQLAKDTRLSEVEVKAACERLRQLGVVRRSGVDSWPAVVTYWAPCFKALPERATEAPGRRAA